MYTRYKAYTLFSSFRLRGFVIETNSKIVEVDPKY